MAGGINSVLSQAKSGLAATQVAMNTTSKNVSNVNTEGYSRQRVDFKTGIPEMYGPHVVGGGVDIAGISRSTSEFVNRRLEEEQSTLGKFQGLSDIYGQLEMIFKEDGEGSVTGAVSQFFNDMRTLSTQPDAVPLRTAVRESAKGVTHRFKTMSESIDQVVTDIDRRLEGAVSEVNRLTDRIASLNNQITTIEITGKATLANDERDQRDHAVLELSKLLDIRTTHLENGSINVSAGTLGPLVMGNDHQDLGAYRSDDGVNGNSMRIFLLSPHNIVPPKDVTNKFESGQVGGLLDLRDNVVPDLRNKVDELAYNLATQINQVHKGAYTRNGKQGVGFFEDPVGVTGAAAGFDLSHEIEQDVTNIAAADVKNAAGDNRALLRITDLETARIFNGGQSSFNDVSSSIIGALGVQIRSANDSLSTQQNVVEQLDTLKKTVSGVSLDEEAMNMLKFQKAFDANAKMIQVADQMMDTIINLKRF